MPQQSMPQQSIETKKPRVMRGFFFAKHARFDAFLRVCAQATGLIIAVLVGPAGPPTKNPNGDRVYAEIANFSW